MRRAFFLRTARSLRARGLRRLPFLGRMQSFSTHSVRDEEIHKLSHPILHTPEPNQTSFLDFGSLVDRLRKEFKATVTGTHDEETAERIKAMLNTVRFNPKEWGQYTNFIGNRYTRTLVGFDHNFVVLLLCWEKGQNSPIHCHYDSSCWVKVLEGQLQETIYKYPTEGGGALTLEKEMIYYENQATYTDDNYGVHKMGNPRTDIPCVSLHIYSPPYAACNVFDRITGARKLVPMGSIYDRSCPFEDDQICVSSDSNSQPGILSNIDKISLETFVERVEDELDNKLVEHNQSNIGPLLEKLVLSPDEWERFVHFGERYYTRNLLLMREKFSIMLLCWNHNQDTPPHRHGGNRHSWFKVLRGSLQMTHFKDDPNERLKVCAGNEPAEVTGSYTIKPGDPATYEGPDDACHALGNPSDSETAVSIHVYSPPYLHLKYECSKDGQEKSLPVVHYGQMLSQMECFGEGWRGCEIFSNFHAFKALLEEAFANADSYHCPELHTKVTNLMSQIQINPDEWRQHAQLHKEHFVRVLISESEHWMLILTCWDKDQGTPIHDHQASYNWIKVLEGQLTEENFQCQSNADKKHDQQGAWKQEKTKKLRADRRVPEEKQYEESRVQLVRSGVLPPDSVTFLNSDIIHRIRNESGRPAFSLHLYSPPYVKAAAYDVVSGDTQLVFLPQEQTHHKDDA
mmetsp:Transcript_888/g.1554  ORF Transcript_888/g.1554 Transcript_888/m.1554 type:complete len:684 (+) Transcript_888:114-2165(+)